MHDKAAHNQDSHNGAQFRQIDVTAGAQPKPSSQNRNKNTHYSHFVFPFYPFNLRAAHQHTLPEVPRRAPEQPHIVLTGDVAVEAGAGALAVAHLAQDPAVGGGDALDGPGGAVGVEGGVHGGRAGEVHVLGGDLPVRSQALQHLRGGHEAALAVGDGDGVDAALFGLHKQRR